MNFRERPLAIVDVETSGDNPMKHELLEIGLIVAHQETLEEISSDNWLIKPVHIETALAAALDRNGYREEMWKDALKLADVMPMFAEKTKDAIFTGFNVSFDWLFIQHAFFGTGASNLMDYHRLDILSLAWFVGGDKLDKLSLKSVSEFFHVSPEPDPHRAINGAKVALEVLKKIRGKI